MRYNFPAFIPALLERFILIFRKFVSRIKTPVLAWLWGVKIGKEVLFQGKIFLRTHGGEISIGDKCTFLSDPQANLVGLVNPTILDTLKGGRISVGSHCGFSSVVMSSRSEIKIGDRVLVGGNVRIFDHDYHSLNPVLRGTAEDFKNVRSRPVSIGNDVFVGTNAIILKGTKIGDRSIVAAGSVVFGLDIPDDSLVKGNPAVVIKKGES